VKGGSVEQALPIVAIYVLGFELPEVNAVAVKAGRTYVDIMCGGEVAGKSPFIESLTHDAYFIQVPRINRGAHADRESSSELKQMLSLFEQSNFVEEKFLKKYPHPITHKNIQKMVERLEYIAADPKMRRIMQEEKWAAMNEAIWEKQVTTLTSQNTTLTSQVVVQANQIAAQSNQIAELQRMLQQAGISIPSA
jgi:hypothetical protein